MKNRICEILGIEKPVIQGPMVWLTDAKLAAAVSNGGGTLPEKVLGTFSIVPLIADAVDHTPVMASGGIADHRAFNAALALGAEGVYCGTAILLSKESRMAENVKKAALAADAEDLLLFRTIPAYYRPLSPSPQKQCTQTSFVDI